MDIELLLNLVGESHVLTETTDPKGTCWQMPRMYVGGGGQIPPYLRIFCKLLECLGAEIMDFQIFFWKLCQHNLERQGLVGGLE